MYFKKSLGQNFLINKGIAKNISDLISDDIDFLIEIGAGKGFLTKEIIKKIDKSKIIIIEKDSRFVNELSEFSNNVINDDILKVNFEKIIQNAKLNRNSNSNNFTDGNCDEISNENNFTDGNCDRISNKNNFTAENCEKNSNKKNFTDKNSNKNNFTAGNCDEISNENNFITESCAENSNKKNFTAGNCDEISNDNNFTDGNSNSNNFIAGNCDGISNKNNFIAKNSNSNNFIAENSNENNFIAGNCEKNSNENNFINVPLRENKNFCIIGNLPYNISTEILFLLIEKNIKLDFVNEMIFMFQKEVADRIISEKGKKSYGKLSILIQSQASIKKILTASPKSFFPAPKVHSTVIKITPHDKNSEILDELKTICSIFFQQRRKTIRSILKKDNEIVLKSCLNASIDTNLRPEELSIEDYVRIAKIFKSISIKNQ